MAAPILPTPDSLVTAAIDAIVAARPTTLDAFNRKGRYYDLVAMWRAQATLALRRLADETKGARLKFATGESLRGLCSSEFRTSLPADPQTALGTVWLTGGTTGLATVVKKGDRFLKRAQPDGVHASPLANGYPLPIAAATYTATQTVYVPPVDTRPGSVPVPIEASAPGPAGNLPLFSNFAPPINLVQPEKPFADSALSVAFVDVAGGSSGITDAVLIAAAKAYAVGQFGPTAGAVLAGVLRQQSARHVAMLPATDALPYAQVYVADESWASSTRWTASVWQSFIDGFQGVGCRCRFGAVHSRAIRANATIVLASTDSLASTDDIDANVRAAAESYFDDRPDWYTWRSESLKAVLGKADDRILYCSSVVVTDAATGSVVAETANQLYASSWAPILEHLYLTDQNCQSTYLPPS